jgi:ATP synthase protein I
METTPPKNPKKKPSLTNYAKYSVMGFQMLAIMGIGIFLGIKIDALLGLQKAPVFTIVLSLVSVVTAIYVVVRDLLKKQ